MSDDSLRFRQCVGKHKHATFDAALREANTRKHEKKDMRKGLKISAYKCNFCDGFHVGHRHKKK